ncbi:hypothetical protein [Desulfobaculum sp.]
MPHLHLTDIPSRDALLTAIKDFLVTNGWTLDLWADDTSSYHSYSDSNNSGEGKRLHLHYGDFWLHMRSATRQTVYGYSNYGNSHLMVDGVRQYREQLTGVALYPARGFDAGSNWDRQPGGPYYKSLPHTYQGGQGSTGALCRIPPGVIPSCHIAAFTDPCFFLLSIQHALGSWRHLLAAECPLLAGGGGLVYGGSGAIASCANPDSHHYFLSNSMGASGVLAPDIRQPNAIDCGGWTLSNFGLRSECIDASSLESGTLSEPLLAYSTPTFAGVHPLIPYYVTTEAKNEHTSGDYILGQLPHFRLTLTSAYTPEQVIQVGDERWMVLPVSDAENPHAIAVRYDGD